MEIMFLLVILRLKCKFGKMSVQCHPLLNAIQIVFT